MEPEEMVKRLIAVFNNNPEDTIERLPEDLEKAMNGVFLTLGEGFGKYASKYTITPVVAGALATAFFAGHEYAVRYGNLNAEMGVSNETLPSTDSK